MWFPSAKLLLLKLACPLPFSATLAARTVAPSVNVTVPVVTGLPPEVTVAVKVTFEPVVDGFGLPATVVVVAAPTAVVISRDQPPDSLSAGSLQSSVMT